LGCGLLKLEPVRGLRFGRIAMLHALRLRNTDKMLSAAKLLAIASHNSDSFAERNVFASFWSKLNTARHIEDWLQHDVLDPMIDRIQDRPSRSNGLESIWLWKKDNETLHHIVSSLPEIIARVGVNLATSGL
jgi:hypothetical protein